uniref:Secreted protein n=1 Tax=Steinernema glaseri TaxID=37863 RepID=A0A1I7YKW3_9BILA
MFGPSLLFASSVAWAQYSPQNSDVVHESRIHQHLSVRLSGRLWSVPLPAIPGQRALRPLLPSSVRHCGPCTLRYLCGTTTLRTLQDPTVLFGLSGEAAEKRVSAVRVVVLCVVCRNCAILD